MFFERRNAMEFVWAFLGLAVGIAITAWFMSIKDHVGTLRIDQSNPDTDVYRIEIDDLDALARKTSIKLKVDHNADLSSHE